MLKTRNVLQLDLLALSNATSMLELTKIVASLIYI